MLHPKIIIRTLPTWPMHGVGVGVLEAIQVGHASAFAETGSCHLNGHFLCTRNDKYLFDIDWVDHWVDQNTALTSVSANEILSIAKITAVGWCLC